ncbi:membrane-associated protease RseP (regulator of RpoE activity) [Nonomuraea thailandensis]|uniref:Membrane-associated protease RseP (Regulator of RpoE activity) n=1 Tax=Nonomuraea thailandensis TaxID=1188745 RepID=A0A9X2GGL1_9ACTN|nr:membrane-associated protease RseP (regulator of RpoE activity) [Nonomuraea thailandensis]
MRGGEIEHGIEWIPFGGCIRVIGLSPPARPGRKRCVRATRTASSTVRKCWQKVINMSGGPLMNFVPAFVFFTVLLVGIGLPTELPTTSSATQTCVITSSGWRAACEPGDRMVSFDGAAIGSWEDAKRLVRSPGAGPVRLGLVRDGKPMTLDVTLIAQDRPTAPLGGPQTRLRQDHATAELTDGFTTADPHRALRHGQAPSPGTERRTSHLPVVTGCRAALSERGDSEMTLGAHDGCSFEPFR